MNLDPALQVRFADTSPEIQILILCDPHRSLAAFSDHMELTTALSIALGEVAV